jgi:hypothetical protein
MLVAGPGPVVHDNLPLLETEEAATLDEFLADAVLRDGLVARLSPTVAAVDPERLEAVVARLKKLGHLPKVI